MVYIFIFHEYYYDMLLHLRNYTIFIMRLYNNEWLLRIYALLTSYIMEHDYNYA